MASKAISSSDASWVAVLLLYIVAVEIERGVMIIWLLRGADGIDASQCRK